MTTFAISMTDGSVAVMQTVGEVTVEACLAKWTASERDKVVSHRPIALADIPTDREFRNAWEWSGSIIDHDMPKARQLHLDALRRLRDPIFARLDAEWMKEFGVGNAAGASVVEAKRQHLRGLPQTVARALKDATTPEALKAIRPEILED